MLANEIRTLISQINGLMLTRSLNNNNLRLAGASLLDIADRVENLERAIVPATHRIPERSIQGDKVVRLDERRRARPVVVPADHGAPA